DRLDVALLVQRLRSDLLLARRDRNRVEENALEVRVGVVGEDAQSSPHVRRLDRQPGTDPREELLHDPRPARHLPLVPAERDLVPPRDDPQSELRLEQTQVLVVSAQKDPEVDLGGKRETLGRGLSHAAGSRPPSQVSGITRAGWCQFPGIGPRPPPIDQAPAGGSGAERDTTSSRASSFSWPGLTGA